jgi:hypothetical protein
MSGLLSRARSALNKLTSFSGLEPPRSHLTLLQFTADNLSSWQLHSDNEMGGYSESTLQPSADGIVWSGNTSRDMDPARQRLVPKSDQKKKASRVGFVAMRMDIRDKGHDAIMSGGYPWTLTDFHGVCIRGRFDHRKYILNIRADNVLEELRPDDLYQALIHPYIPFARPVGEDSLNEAHPAGPASMPSAASSDAGAAASAADGPGSALASAEQLPLLDVRVPWSAFTLTWRGYIQADSPPPMHLDRITHVGLLLSDPTAETTGPFRLELNSLSAFRYDDHEMEFDPHVREAIRLNTELGYEDIRSG